MSTELHGWLTPWAEVLCSDCLGRPGLVHEANDDVMEATCDKCGRSTLTDKPLAMEQKLAKALQAQGIDASVWQTGGMIPLTGFRAGGREILASWGNDGPADDPMGTYFMVSVVDGDGQEVVPTAYFRSFEETEAYFREAVGRHGTPA